MLPQSLIEELDPPEEVMAAAWSTMGGDGIWSWWEEETERAWLRWRAGFGEPWWREAMECLMVESLIENN